MTFAMVLVGSLLMEFYFTKAVSVALPSHEKPTRTIPLSRRSKVLRWRFKSGVSQTPTISRRVKLFCRAGYSIAVTVNNTVRGVDEAFCLKTTRCIFELQSYGKSLVRLKNIKSGTFIAISNKGIVYVTKQKSKDTLFSQIQQSTSFETFSSVKYHGKRAKASQNWYLALRKGGIPKKAFRTNRLHKSTQFVTIKQDL